MAALRKKMRKFLIAGFLFLLTNNLAFASDLIEPTRTLSGMRHKVGKLSVFSEPPNLEVKMDGTVIGETPVELQAVEPGFHVIQVKGSEIDIYVKPEKPVKLSWFKGSFVEIPAEAKEYRQPPLEQKKESPRIKTPEQPAGKKEKPYPLYWPLNPTGPIN